MGIRKKKPEPKPEPEPVKVPSRGVLLNKWAARQDKLKKLVDQVTSIKAELVTIAQQLHESYGVLVQDTTHTVTLPKATPPEKQVPAEGTAEGKPEAPTGTTPNEEGKPVELLDPEKNPLAKSPIPIVVDQPSTQPATEEQIRKIREDSKLTRGGDPNQMAQDVATSLDRAVRLGLGKQ